MAKMKQKNTEELLEELKYKKADIQKYIDSNANSMIEVNLKNHWHDLIIKSNMSNANIINKADIGYTYFYDIINGKKVPNADKIVRMFLAMKLTLDECNLTLKYCGKRPLYPKFKRDSILIFALTNKLTVAQTNTLLKQSDESELR